MKKIINLLIVISLFVCTTAYAATKVDRNACVAVMDFGTRPGASTAEIDINNAEYISCEYIINRLVNRGCFTVMEKDVVINKLKAAGLKTTGIIDPVTAKRIGDLLKCKYIIYGNVNNVSVSDTGANVGGLGTDVFTVKAHIVARMMDVDTGSIIMMARGDGRSKSSFTGLSVERSLNVKLGDVAVVKIKLPCQQIAGFGTVDVTLDSVHNAIRKAAYSTVDDFMFKLFKEKKPKV